MDFLNFAFASGPHFVGVMVLITVLVIAPLAIVADTIAAIAKGKR
jgi:hypothetical protein